MSECLKTNNTFNLLHTTYLLLGTNLGNRVNQLLQAEVLISQHCGTIAQTSSIYETAAWGLQNQPNFLNKVIKVKTKLTASELLTTILQIEESMGRKRTIKMGPRVIDIDILFMQNFNHISTPNLTIPHPAIAQRRFVLTPLVELIPEYIHPTLKKTMQQLLQQCPDQLSVKKFLL